MFPGDRITLVNRADEMAVVFDRLEPQRPATCGAYVLSYLFPALGLHRHAGHDLTAEDYLAHLAAVIIDDDEVPASQQVSRRVDAGELTEPEALRQFGRIWYRYPVRSLSDPVRVGTSPTGVARAIDIGSSGRMTTLPVAARLEDGRVQLTPERWVALLDALSRHVDDWRWHAIFNYQPDRLLGPRDPAYTLENLRAADAEHRIPHDSWGVGHFVGLAGLWRMHGDGPWWLLLLDTYKDRGFDGYEPQPASLMRAGMTRDDGRGGGMLLVVQSELASEASSEIDALGIDLRIWSNGSPEPDDWVWHPPLESL